MEINKVSTPEIYRESMDFRFFLKWFENSLTKLNHDTEEFYDLYDPLRCPHWLLWMLGDTVGFKYDNRLPTSYNRLVILYFMSMIRHRGSKDGVTLGAEINLKQFDIDVVAGKGYTDKSGNFIPPKDILYNRLEDTSIPVNSVSVTPHVEDGYIDIVYFSDKLPIDACIEYVRPLGMYCLQHAGVKLDARTKLSIDARLTNQTDVGLSIGSTRVGHYSREDYASIQKIAESDVLKSNQTITIKDGDSQPWNTTRTKRQQAQQLSHPRRNAWIANSDSEGYQTGDKVEAKERIVNPGYRALYSLQLCNNEHIVKSLVPNKPAPPGTSLTPGELLDGKDLTHQYPIFGLGWNPQDITVSYPDNYVLPNENLEIDPQGRIRSYNLLYDKELEAKYSKDIYTIEDSRSNDIVNPRPAVNPVMHKVGDAISINPSNTQYIFNNDTHQGVYNVESDGQITTQVTDKSDIKLDE